jgi:tellurite resistance protein
MDEARQNAAMEQAIADGMFDDHEDDVLEVTIQSVDMAIGE